MNNVQLGLSAQFGYCGASDAQYEEECRQTEHEENLKELSRACHIAIEGVRKAHARLYGMADDEVPVPEIVYNILLYHEGLLPSFKEEVEE